MGPTIQVVACSIAETLLPNCKSREKGRSSSNKFFPGPVQSTSRHTYGLRYIHRPFLSVTCPVRLYASTDISQPKTLGIPEQWFLNSA